MKPLTTLLSSQPTLEQTQKEKETVTFFTRTDSVSANSEEEVQRSNDQFFGEEKGVFNRPVETYPLAKQPHLLQPYAQKEQLFGSGGRDSMGGMRDETSKTILPVSYSRNDSRYMKNLFLLLCYYGSIHVHASAYVPRLYFTFR